MWKKVVGLATVGTLVAGNAFAAFELPVDAAVDMSPVEAVMGIIATGLLAMWGIRKFVKTTNRS
jgi:hypothetical protein